MKKLLASLAVVLLIVLPLSARPAVSPDGRISVEQKNGSFTVRYGCQLMLEIPQIGIRTTSTGEAMTFMKRSKARRVSDRYDMLSGKRLHCSNEANEYTYLFTDASHHPIRLVFRLYNDGIAFRYELENLQGEHLVEEKTTYRIAEGTRRWMQQWADSYEGFFPLSETSRIKPVPSYGPQSVSKDGYNTRWGYPALVEPHDGLFMLITEANIERRQSASCLRNDDGLDLYRVCADKNEVDLNGDWHTPWRVVIMGKLADVVESTLITDVSNPCCLTDTQWIKPGVVSWIYWAYNHGSNDYQIIKQYVDMAATLRLPYVLIDAEWDEMKDGKTIEDAIDYAKKKGVSPLIWYNSSVGWVDGAPTPKFRLNKPEDREKEFAWCERQGIAGVKIDFFSGDNQMNMDYCLDLLECAARHHLLVNFHGATIPRGWQRTYPNLLTTEAVYGAEWYNNVPTFTDKAATHNATLPFTRNVIGPMDYTPCTFSDSQHPHITTKAHELALTVLYESGLQHLADKPESYFSQPAEVQQFLSELPCTWDDTRLVAGYPASHAVIARRKGNTWYIAGINGNDAPQTIPLDLSFIGSFTSMKSFMDAPDQGWSINRYEELPTKMELQSRGGFVMIIKKHESNLKTKK